MPHHSSGHGFIHATLSAATKAGNKARIDAAIQALKASGAPDVTVVSLMDAGQPHPGGQPAGTPDTAAPGSDVFIQVKPSPAQPHASQAAHQAIAAVEARLLNSADPAGGKVLQGVIARWCCYSDA